jgi:Flp pilus assembly protein TadD
MRLGPILFCSLCAASSSAHAAEACGDLANAYGPYDYRVAKAELKPVEDFHFDIGVERLQRGKSGYLAGDIDYTLRASPNHHRALLAMDKLAAKSGTDHVPRASYSVACYYDRAVRFRPEDGTVRMLYAHYLARKKKPDEAVVQLQHAEKLLGRNANLHYNMGLAYLDMKDYDKALAHAHIAYQLGFPLPGLRNRLERAGKWRDPQVTEAPKVESPVTDAAKADRPLAEEPKADAAAGGGETTAKP